MTPFATGAIAANGLAPHRPAALPTDDKPGAARFAELLQAQRAVAAPAPTTIAPQGQSAQPQKTPQPPAQTAGRSQAAVDAARQERAATERAHAERAGAQGAAAERSRAERAEAGREQPPGKTATEQRAGDASAGERADAARQAERRSAEARGAERRADAAADADTDTATADTAAATEDAAPTAVAPGDASETEPTAAASGAVPPWFAALAIVPPPARPVPLSAQGAAMPPDTPLEGAAALPAGAQPGAMLTAAADAKAEPASHDPALAGASGQDFAALLAAAPDAQAVQALDAAATAAPTALDLAAPAGALGAHPAAPPGAHALAGSPAAPVATLATPLHAPDFSQALAAQLATFARDGVQEATLQLNPAEMGPIQVQITVDGQQAQIDFSAAHAATRQALEHGLPTLAAALHAEGLTLSGGGVFEQRQPASRDASGQAGDGMRRRGRDGVDAVGAEAARSAPLPAARGLLDLYA